MYIASVCSNVMQNFADKTTIHGFFELYYAKSFVWKTIWLLTIVGALGITTYQITNVVLNAIESQTKTAINQLSTDPVYERIRICYRHWLHWVDWNRSLSYGFDKYSTLYGLAYMADIISETEFNVTEAEARFKETMERNGWSTLMQFYSSIAYPTPPGFTPINADWERWENEINQRKGYFCYVASSEMIDSVLKQRSASGIDPIIAASYNPNYYQREDRFVSETEHNHYIIKLLEHLVDSKLKGNKTNVDFSKFKGSPVIIFDNTDKQYFGLAHGTFETYVKITMTLYNWINSSEYVCNSDKFVTSMYSMCFQYCESRHIKYHNASQCLEIRKATLISEDTLDKVCIKKISFLNGKVVKNSRPYFVPPFGDYYQDCLKLYCNTACTEWRYSTISYDYPVDPVLSNFEFDHRLIIEYPETFSIFELTEVYSDSFESLIGTAGGIVGLWAGGSLMSILQMIYLLCCSRCDERVSSFNRKEQVKDAKVKHVYSNGGLHRNYEM